MLSPERTVLALSPLHQPHCGTGIRPDRDIAARRSDIKTSRRLCDAVAKPSAQTRAASRVLDVRKRLRKRDRLSAGGKWIRTFGPPVSGTTLSRLPPTPASRFVADSPLKEGHSEASPINADASYRPHR